MKWRTRAIEIMEDVRDSYWLVPGLLAFAGFSLGLALVLLDARLGEQWLGNYEWFYGSRPAGARQILATIAGSTITVAGVVFSITLAAVTYASGQYGPRLLSNFIRDRGNQATLGVFVGTFLYCLVVLRTIRSAEEASADAGNVVEAFVPHVAMFGALALAIAAISVLIYFVHHVTFSIHINNVIAAIGRSLIDDIRKRRDTDRPRADQPAVPTGSNAVDILADRTGYIEAIDTDALLEITCRQDLLIQLSRRAGDFVHKGRPLLQAQPGDKVDPAILDSCKAAFVIGSRRTALQDLRFGIDELVEIAARALSPGVNDPFTAIACVDWLGAALSEIGYMPPPVSGLVDEKRQVRVIMRDLGFADYVASAFGQLRPYVARDPNARRSTLTTLEEVMAGLPSEAYRRVVLDERRALELCADDQGG